MTKKNEETIQEVKGSETKVLALTEEFANGDLNTLRDKINELIKVIG